jgi:hypothetical protein
MAKNSPRTAEKSKSVPPREPDSKSLKIADAGIHTGNDFAKFMSAVMTDVISGRISPGIANAACNAGGKLLKVVELQYRYGTPGPNATTRILKLAHFDEPVNAIAPVEVKQ